MTLPNDEKCRHVIKELDGEPMLTKWEAEFITSNRERTVFTTSQKDVIARLLDKYEV